MSRWQLPLAVWLTAGLGLINLLSAVTPSLATRLTLTERLPLIVRQGSHLTASLAEFSLAGGHNRTRRANYNQFTKRGFSATVQSGPLPAEVLNEVHAISDAWLAMVHGREKRFFMGWFEDDYIGNAPVITVHTPQGQISAFANIVPEYQRNEISADLIRHRPEAEKGTMDFLFVSFFQWAKAEGYDSFNLSLSPLAGVGEQPDNPKAEQALHYIYEHFNQLYNFKGLHQFKEKFQPEWSPRYLIYPNPASLPAIAWALNRASAGDDFVWDYVRDFFGRTTS